MDLQLKNKVIIVTGGSKGIGEAISRKLFEEGAIPFIVGRDEESVMGVCEELRLEGSGQKSELRSQNSEVSSQRSEGSGQKLGSGNKRVGYAIAELTDEKQCLMAVEKAVEEFGTVHGLVNNAGINDGVGLESGNIDSFRKSLEKNVVHYYTMAHYCLPYLKQNKGSIVNIGSKVSYTGQGGTSGYAAACGGRNALTREWAAELLPYGIRVNLVVVAESYTPLYKKWIQTFSDPQKKLDAIQSKIPLEKRMTTPEEISDTVVFLLSEKSGHTTGQLVFVDGGYTHLDRSIT